MSKPQSKSQRVALTLVASTTVIVVIILKFISPAFAGGGYYEPPLQPGEPVSQGSGTR